MRKSKKWLLIEYVNKDRENHHWLGVVISDVFEYAPQSSVMENKYITAGLARYP